MYRLIFLTGKPRTGKTYVLLRTIDVLKAKGYKIGGMISRELRKQGIRLGFEVVDLKTGRKGWLAHIKQPTGPRVGKYRVNLRDLNIIGVHSILKAIEEDDIVVVDEIGPMELYSSNFKEAVIRGVKSCKLMIGTIHYRTLDPLINMIKSEQEAEILEVTKINRELLKKVLTEKVQYVLQK